MKTNVYRIILLALTISSALPIMAINNAYTSFVSTQATKLSTKKQSFLKKHAGKLALLGIMAIGGSSIWYLHYRQTNQKKFFSTLLDIPVDDIVHIETAKDQVLIKIGFNSNFKIINSLTSNYISSQKEKQFDEICFKIGKNFVEKYETNIKIVTLIQQSSISTNIAHISLDAIRLNMIQDFINQTRNKHHVISQELTDRYAKNIGFNQPIQIIPFELPLPPF